MPPFRSTPMKFRTTVRPLEFASASPLSPLPTTLSAMITPSALLTPTDHAPEPWSAVAPSWPTPTLLKRISELSGTPAMPWMSMPFAEPSTTLPSAADLPPITRVQRAVDRLDADVVRQREVPGRVRADEVGRDDVVVRAGGAVDQDPVGLVPGDEVACADPADRVAAAGDDDPLVVLRHARLEAVVRRADVVLRDRVAARLDDDPGGRRSRRAFDGDRAEAGQRQSADRRAVRPGARARGRCRRSRRRRR